MIDLTFSDQELRIIHDALVTAPLSWGVVDPVVQSIRHQLAKPEPEEPSAGPSPEPRRRGRTAS